MGDGKRGLEELLETKTFTWGHSVSLGSPFLIFFVGLTIVQCFEKWP